MYHFNIPSFTPRTFEELHPEPDEVTSLVYLEDSIAKELNLIRNHNKELAPLGQLPEQEETPSDGEDDGNGTPVSELSEEGTAEGSAEDEEDGEMEEDDEMI